MKKLVNWFIASQLLIIAMMLLIIKEVTLTSYINMSFFVGGTITFIGLLVYVVSNGFFDIFTMSFRKVFSSKRSLVDTESMRAPSELLDFQTKPFFQLGGSILLAMLIALTIYYLA